MKTITQILKTSIFSFLLITGVSAFAENPTKKESTILAEKEIVSDIKSQIIFPEFLLESNLQEHQAELSFKITECGFLQIVKITTEEKKLQNDLRNQLSKIRLNPQGLNQEDIYKVVLRFKTL